MMSPHLQAIRASVTSLVDHIDAAARARHAGPWIERHPLAFAIASLGLELLGWRLLVRARPHHDDVLDGTWWNPPDSDGYLH